jgi:type VI protein secretion system component VasK
MKRRIWSFLFIILAALIVFLFFRLLARPDLKNDRGAALQTLSDMVPPDLKDLSALVVANYREYRANSVRWSAAYFGCIFGSALLSALAGVLLKWEGLARRPALKNDLAASFAAIAALLITLSTLGDFQRKWEANRVAASAMENLAYDLVKPRTAVDRNAVLERIQEINEARTVGVVGEPRRSPGTAKRPKEEPTPEVPPAHDTHAVKPAGR